MSSISEKEPKRKSFDFMEDLAAKIKARNEKVQEESQSTLPLTDEKPMVKLEFPLTEIKSEPTEFITYPRITPSNGYSEEPEVITLDDSEDEETFAQSFKDSTNHNSTVERSDRF